MPDTITLSKVDLDVLEVLQSTDEFESLFKLSIEAGCNYSHAHYTITKLEGAGAIVVRREPPPTPMVIRLQRPPRSLAGQCQHLFAKVGMARFADELCLFCGYRLPWHRPILEVMRGRGWLSGADLARLLEMRQEALRPYVLRLVRMGLLRRKIDKVERGRLTVFTLAALGPGRPSALSGLAQPS